MRPRRAVEGPGMAIASWISVPPGCQSVAEMRTVTGRRTGHTARTASKPPRDAAGPPDRRRSRRCGCSTAGRGTRTAGSRARSADRAVEPASAAPGGVHELGADHREVGLVSSAGTGLAGSMGSGTARRRSSRRWGSGSSMPSHMILVEPLRRSAPAARRSAPGCARHELDDPGPGRLLGVGCRAGAPRRDPAGGDDADHLGHHQAGPPSALLPRCTGGNGPGNPVLRAVHVPWPRPQPGSAVPAHPAERLEHRRGAPS